MRWKLLQLRQGPSGMFSNVNEVVQQAYLALQGGYQYVIEWSKSAYRDPARPEDPWLYYFESTWPDFDGDINALEVLPGGSQVACTRDNIITPREVDGKCNPLLMPTRRFDAKAVIDQFIIPNETTRAIVDAYVNSNFSGPVVGLHLRGPGRLHGGAAELRRSYSDDGQVVIPFDAYFHQVDAALDQMNDGRVFACSDSSEVIEIIQKKYGDKLITNDASRSEFGEMQHFGHPENEGLTFDKYNLGMDVLVEALLLSRTTYLVHGNSNVANFVLCNHPELDHYYVPA